ncbi:MAG: D-alanyl-D-alanine carboxypeptidase [Firmicutes bacterium]|nr:D-alanyl-D-alanine carboxypeptidase [Bacillota bacterium]
MRKIFAILLIIIFSVSPVSADEPDISALGAVLMEKESGRIVYGRNADKAMAPASTTKIMTAVIVLENSRLDKVVCVDKEACAAPKVKMGLKAGEKITVEQLLYALMLQSSNDAAVALAIDTAGSVEHFAALMNAKAVEIGCKDTLLVTPNGIDKGGHHSTARDMALIASYALDNADFCRIIQTKNVNFKTDKASYSVYNHDRFLNEYSGALGIKTGFTGKAGHCFAGAARRNGLTLISVVFASGWGNAGKESKWRDTKALMDYGFKNYKYRQIVKKGTFVRDINVKNGAEKTLRLVLAKDFGTAFAGNEKYMVSCDLPTVICAPVKAGQTVGSAKIFVGGECVADIPVAAEKSVCRFGFGDNFFAAVKMWCGLVLTSIIQPCKHRCTVL